MGYKQPTFSIIVPTFARTSQRLAACLESLAGLDYPRSHFEVIVVDDGSQTPMEATVAPFRNQLDLILLTQSHAGPAMARNTGAVRARGEFLAFIDDDCEAASNWLEALAARVATDPDRVIGGRIVNALPRNSYSTASQLLIDYLFAYYNADHGRARFFVSMNLAVPARYFRTVGGFDTTFMITAGEDRELCDRWLDLGYQLTYAPEVLVYHAHRLTFRTFWRQHFNYGRGAFEYHKARAQHGKRFWVEPPSFYSNLIRYPFSQVGGPRAIWLVVLLAISQVANMVGFVWRALTYRPDRGHQS